MKNNRFKITVTLALAAIVMSTVYAQPRGVRGEKDFFSLNLSGEQQEQMKALKVEHYKIMKPLTSKMAELKARERALMSEENVDMKSVYSVIDDQTELLNKIRKLQANHKLAVREILTDEQLMKLDQRRKIVEKRNRHWDRPDGPHRPGRYDPKNMG